MLGSTDYMAITTFCWLVTADFCVVAGDHQVVIAGLWLGITDQ